MFSLSFGLAKRRAICVTCLCCLLAILGLYVKANAAAPAKEAKSDSQIFREITDLLHLYFPRAKILPGEHKLHFEYKAHTLLNTYSNREELAPDSGGVVGDVAVNSGRFKDAGKMPRVENQYYYTALLLAPYNDELDKNLHGVLRYAPDTPSEFVDHFKKIVSQFGTIATPESEKTANATVGSAQPELPRFERRASNSTDTPIAEPPTADQKQRLFLWKATRGNETVYLLGTVHVATASLYPLPSEIDDVFDQSKLLVVEVAIDRHKVDPAKVQELVKSFGTYIPPDRLSKHLSADTKALFDKYLSWAGESWSLYEPYKPWYVTEMVEASVPRRGEILNIKGGLGIDNYMLGRAKAQAKLVDELETVDFQIGLMSRLSEGVQDKLLQIELLDFQSGPDQIKALLDAWKNGDLEKMDKIVNRTVIEHPDLAPFHKMLLDQRNQPMAEKIEQFAMNKPGPIFVAVGSAHMLGDTGLVSALRKRGFTVEQMRSSSTPQSVPAVTPNTDKLTFMSQGFKIWMPHKPEESVSGSQPQVTSYKLLEEGGESAYVVCCFELPSDPTKWNVPGPLILDKILSAIVGDTKGTDCQWRSKPLGELPSRQVEFALTPSSITKVSVPRRSNNELTPPDRLISIARGLPNPNATVRINAYLRGNRVYLIMTCGSKHWTSSANPTKFLNSFEFMN